MYETIKFVELPMKFVLLSNHASMITRTPFQLERRAFFLNCLIGHVGIYYHPLLYSTRSRYAFSFVPHKQNEFNKWVNV